MQVQPIFWPAGPRITPIFCNARAARRANAEAKAKAKVEPNGAGALRLGVAGTMNPARLSFGLVGALICLNDRAMSVAPVRAVRGTGICGYPPPPSCRAGPTDTFSGGISMLARINSGNQCLSFIMYAATHVYDLTFF